MSLEACQGEFFATIPRGHWAKQLLTCAFCTQQVTDAPLIVVMAGGHNAPPQRNSSDHKNFSYKSQTWTGE